MASYFDFENADAFATGAIGRPGDRTFYVQIRADGKTISVKCEKSQVAAMAEYLRNMLADMPDTSNTFDSSSAALQSPVDESFVLGSVGLGVDRPNMRMVIQLEEMVLVEEDDEDIFDLLDEDDDDADSTVVRVQLTPAQARAFCDTADLFVNAGRAICKWCAAPVDPAGHACPKFN